jgi:hypothetical protein
MSYFVPKISVLPPAQKSFWEKLDDTPRSFVLYGGTAVALRLGHRQSQDFDFFSNEAFKPENLLAQVSYLRSAQIDLRGDNTLTVTVESDGPVKISFFGNLEMTHIADPELAQGSQVYVASLIDVTATKMKTVQQRAEWKDYCDVLAAMDAGISIPEALAAARAIYGAKFNPLSTLKALTYFDDGTLQRLSEREQRKLRTAASAVDIKRLPAMGTRPGILPSLRE